MKIMVLGNQARALVNFWTVLMEAMAAEGHEVICCVPAATPEDGPWLAALQKAGRRVLHYPLDRKGLNPLRDMESTGALYRIFANEKPDMLFASTIKPVIYGCMAARLAKVPHIFATITGLGFAFESDSFMKKCLNQGAVLLYTLALSGAEKVFFQNADDREVFAKAGIVRDARKVVMCRGTGVDVQHFAKAPLPCSSPPSSDFPLASLHEEGAPVFLLVARLLEAKGLREYAEAAKILKAQYPAARFQLLGPPEQGLGSVPLTEVEGWHKEGFIEYLGKTGDVRPYVSAASVMVLPSWREGTPCSIMEGMSMGRAAVVTDAPGCREVVREGENGFLTPLRDARALAYAMERFIKDPTLVSSMGNAGRALAEEEFDARKVAAHIMAAMGL